MAHLGWGLRPWTWVGATHGSPWGSSGMECGRAGAPYLGGAQEPPTAQTLRPLL